jgi:hypothetical protein
MALFAGVLSRPQILHRGVDRPVIVVENIGDQLVRAVDLGLDEMLRAGTDVTLDARHPGVGPALVGHELRVHRGMANLAAKLGRFRVVKRLETAKRTEADEEDCAGAERHQALPLLPVGKIQAPLVRHRLRMFDRPAALRPRAEKHHPQTGQQKARRHDIGEDTEIRILVAAHQIHPRQKEKRKESAQCHHTADSTDPVVKV